jgi:hypothetical protein
MLEPMLLQLGAAQHAVSDILTVTITHPVSITCSWCHQCLVVKVVAQRACHHDRLQKRRPCSSDPVV